MTFDLSSYPTPRVDPLILVFSAGDSNKELGSVRFGSRSHSLHFAAQSPGQHGAAACTWSQRASPGPDPRQPGSSSWKPATRYKP